MFSTDVVYGLPVPRFHPAALEVPTEMATDSAKDVRSSQDKLYRPGEVLKKSASFDSDLPETQSLPTLLGACTQAAQGARCAAAVIKACSKESSAGPVAGRIARLPELPESPSHRLEDPDVTLKLGSPELPTVGSASHRLGLCKPCAFVFTAGCQSGINCQFCHLCEQGEKKRRKKEKRELKRLGLYPRRGGTVAATGCEEGLPAPYTTFTPHHELAPSATSLAAPGLAAESFPSTPDATTLAADGARRAAAIIAASVGEPERELGRDTSCSNRSTADTDDLQSRILVEGSGSKDGAESPETKPGESSQDPVGVLSAAAAAATAADEEKSYDAEARSSDPGASGLKLEAAVVETLGASGAELATEEPLAEARTLKLEDAVAPPKLGSPGLPTVGSAFHQLGTCKPCAFAFTGRCQSGIECKFCHLCAPGERGRRKKERRQRLNLVWG